MWSGSMNYTALSENCNTASLTPIFTMMLGACLLTMHISASGQTNAWRNFVALESSRENVETILGKPDNYFETYGTYETEDGRFSVWYTKGGCHKGIEGLQWNVSAQKMIRYQLKS